MTVLISHVNRLRKEGKDIPAVACASTGDTSAALAAYGLRQVSEPWFGCRVAKSRLHNLCNHSRTVQRCSLSTRISMAVWGMSRSSAAKPMCTLPTQKIVKNRGPEDRSFRNSASLRWQLPDWVVIPGGNLGNVSALVRGFEQLAGRNHLKFRASCAHKRVQQIHSSNPLRMIR